MSFAVPAYAAPILYTYQKWIKATRTKRDKILRIVRFQESPPSAAVDRTMIGQWRQPFTATVIVLWRSTAAADTWVSFRELVRLLVFSGLPVSNPLSRVLWQSASPAHIVCSTRTQSTLPLSNCLHQVEGRQDLDLAGWPKGQRPCPHSLQMLNSANISSSSNSS